MSGQRKKANPLLKSSYSTRIDTKSSLLSTSTTSVSKKPKTNAELIPHVTDREDGKRLVRHLSSDKPKTINTPSVKLIGTAPKLSDKYALSTKVTRKPGESSSRELTTHPKTEAKGVVTSTKPAQPSSKLKSTQLQTKSLVLSASKSGLLTSKKLTTSSLQSSSKLPLSSHVGGGSSLLSSSRTISSTRSSVKPSSLKSQSLTSKTSQFSVKSSVPRSRLGASWVDVDGAASAAAPHYDLKLETARSTEEDETAVFLPPELDPFIQDQAIPTVNVLQVRK